MRTRRQAASQKPLPPDEASQALALLLQRLVTDLPPLVLIIVLRPLPKVELARLACVHKAFLHVQVFLHQEQPGPRYSPPASEDIQEARSLSLTRLARASFFGDVAVVKALLGSDGTRPCPLWQRVVDDALFWAALHGNTEVMNLLLDVGGADVRWYEGAAFRVAAQYGH